MTRRFRRWFKVEIWGAAALREAVMVRILAIVSILCLVTVTALAQAAFNGKWETDQSDKRQQMHAEFKVDGDKVTGTLSYGGLGGSFNVIENGQLKGSQIQFRITHTIDSKTGQTLPKPDTIDWTGEIVDANTLRLCRYIPVNLPLNSFDRVPDTNVKQVQTTEVPATPGRDTHCAGGLVETLHRAK